MVTTSQERKRDIEGFVKAAVRSRRHGTPCALLALPLLVMGVPMKSHTGIDAGSTRRSVLAALAAAALLSSGLPATASTEWPTKPVTLVVPFPPGGFTDMMARMLADSLSRKHGQTFIVDNRPGAGGALAAGQVARARPDGYTLMFGSAGQMIVVPMLQKVSYDAEKQLVPLGIFGIGPMVLGVRPGLPVESLQELIAYAKANPGKINVASGGPGTLGNLTAALLAKRAGIEIVMVPYKGGGQNINALLAGEADMYFGNASELVQQKSKVKLLAVSTLKPIPSIPDVPPVASLFPGFQTSAWNGLVGPAGLPAEVAEKISSSASEAARDPAVMDRLLTLGIEPSGANAAEHASIVTQERLTMREAIEAAGLKPER